MSLFGKKWAEPVYRPQWAALAFFTDKINWLTAYRVREVRQLDDYAWRRATEVRGK